MISHERPRLNSSGTKPIVLDPPQAVVVRTDGQP